MHVKRALFALTACFAVVVSACSSEVEVQEEEIAVSDESALKSACSRAGCNCTATRLPGRDENGCIRVSCRCECPVTDTVKQ